MEENNNKKGKKAVKIILIILAILLALLIALSGTYLILHSIGKKQFHAADQHLSAEEIKDDIEINEDEVTYNDKTYILNKNIVTILFMGVDKDNIDENLGYGQSGQADSIFAAAIDTKTGSIKIIPISRETMVDVNLYSETGDYVGVEKKQICLAYAYGNTPKESSENVLNSARRALYGINISSYVTIDLEGMSIITDTIGGVRLTSIEDMKLSTMTVTEGQSILLKGKDAISYIRSREQDVDANNRRMARQKQFLSAFASQAGNQILSNFSKLGTYYNMMTPYTSTNLSFSQITYLASSFLTADIGSQFQYATISGETVKGEEWVEFYPDKDNLLQVIMDTFYIEK